jgi:hypothetical protein
MTGTWYEHRYDQGLELGRQQGQRLGFLRFAKQFLEHRFGPINPRALEKLESWPDERLDELGQALVRGQTSLKELGLEE